MPKQMHLAQFLLHGPTYHSLAMWRHPLTDSRYDWARPELYQHIARVCERGKFDMVFFADFVLTFYNYRHSIDPAIRYGVQTPVHDPVPLLSWMAAVTSQIGLATTFSVSQQHPFYVARLFATLDHLTRGRVGWNVVTSVNRVEAFQSHDEVYQHDERYERADEFLDVCYQLWRSWEADAVLMDREGGMFADPAKVHRIDHEGRHFRSRGPLNVIHSPQTGPAIIQAGASPRGRDFAAKHAEAIFAIQPFVEGAADYYADIKGRMAKLGRDPETCKILFGVQPFVAATEAAARDLQEQHNRLVSLEAALTILSGHLGYDFSQLDPDDLLQPFESRSSQGVVDMYTKIAGKQLTVKQAALMHGRSVGLPQLVGTPEQIADQLEAYYAQAGGDGFMLSMAYTPGSLETFVDEVVPVLQKRGRLRTEYTGNTLREHLRQSA